MKWRHGKTLSIDSDLLQRVLYRDIEQHNRIAGDLGPCAMLDRLSRDTFATMEFLNAVGIKGTVLYDTSISRFRGVCIGGYYERVPLHMEVR